MSESAPEPNGGLATGQRLNRPSLPWTIIATTAVVLVAPWVAVSVWLKGRPDVLVMIGLVLATPILAFIGILFGVAVHASRVAKYEAGEREALEDPSAP